MDANGRWSLAATRHFYKSQGPVEGEPRISRIEYRWYYSGTPASPTHSIETVSSDNPVLLEELAPMEDFVEGRTYQLVLTPYDGLGRPGISFTHSALYQPVSINAPTVSSPSAAGITYSSATLGGSVTDDGGATITECGIVFAPFSLNSNPLMGGPAVTKVETTGALGAFVVNAGGLTNGTFYAFKAYAVNSEGVAYSSTGTFITDTNITLGLNDVATVEHRSIAAGETQIFHFTLADPRANKVTTVGATGLSAELLDDSGGVIESYNGVGYIDLDAVLRTGTYVLRVTNTGGNAKKFSLTLDARTTAEARPLVTVSTALLISKKLKRVGATALIGNTGNLTSSMRIRGTTGNKQFAVIYFNGGNVTAAMSAGTFITAVRADGDAPIPITLSVSPNRRELLKKGKVIKKSLSIQIVATAVETPTKSGSAGIRVQTK
jgi:hypothetical protein